MSKRDACVRSYEKACRIARPDGLVLVPASEAGRLLAEHKLVSVAIDRATGLMHRSGNAAYWRHVVDALWGVRIEETEEMGGAA